MSGQNGDVEKLPNGRGARGACPLERHVVPYAFVAEGRKEGRKEEGREGGREGRKEGRN